jgi:hypothetical protein
LFGDQGEVGHGVGDYEGFGVGGEDELVEAYVVGCDAGVVGIDVGGQGVEGVGTGYAQATG